MSPGSPGYDSPAVPTTGAEIAVDRFLRSLQRALAAGDLQEANSLYEHEFNRLTDRHFTDTEWPHPDHNNFIRNITSDGLICRIGFRWIADRSQRSHCRPPL